MDQPKWYGYNLLGNEKALDLGCGVQKVPGSIGVDMNAETAADVVHNLDVVPYPLPDDSFDIIFMNHCFEHLLDPRAALQECLRVARPNASIFIMMPHFTNASSFGDVTHRRHFSYRALPGLAKDVKSRRKSLVVAKMKITARIFPFTPLINLAPRFWEDYLCYMITGRTLYYRLQVTNVDTV